MADDIVTVKVTGAIALSVMLGDLELKMSRHDADNIKQLIKDREYEEVQNHLGALVLEQHAETILSMVDSPEPDIDDIEIDGELLDWEA